MVPPLARGLVCLSVLALSAVAASTADFLLADEQARTINKGMFRP
jgi:hypothetical protein